MNPPQSAENPESSRTSIMSEMIPSSVQEEQSMAINMPSTLEGVATKAVRFAESTPSQTPGTVSFPATPTRPFSRGARAGPDAGITTPHFALVFEKAVGTDTRSKKATVENPAVGEGGNARRKWRPKGKETRIEEGTFTFSRTRIGWAIEGTQPRTRKPRRA